MSGLNGLCRIPPCLPHQGSIPCQPTDRKPADQHHIKHAALASRSPHYNERQVDALVPITDNQRQQIIDLHSQGLSRNDIARQTGVSAGSVTNVCKQNDLSFDRSKSEKATEARRVDDKVMRTLIASDALSVVHKVSEILTQRLAAGADDIPTRDLITMYGVLTDKHIAIAKLDADNSEAAAAVDQWLAMMTGGLRGSPTAGGESPPSTG